MNSRRSSEEIVYAILKFLEENDRSVKLNDIAIEIGSNTKLVQRWLKIIKDIQLKPELTFEDKRGSKIRLQENGNKSYSDNKFGIYVFNTTYDWKQHLVTWIAENKGRQPSIFNGNWKINTNPDNALLVIHEPNSLKIGDPINLLEKPALLIGQLEGLLTSQREAFFFVMGWLTAPRVQVKQNHGISSLDMLSLLTNNLISGIFTETEENYLQELFPLLLTDIGLLDPSQSINKEELIAFIQIVANIIDTRVNEREEILSKAEFWSTLNHYELSKLIDNEIGRLLVSKINYCLLNPNSYTKWPENRDEFREYHVWEVITQIELRNLRSNSSDVLACLFYLENNSNPTNDILFNYVAHLINTEPKPLDYNLIPSNVPGFYKLLNQINPILLNMNYSSSWNWNDLGKLISFYNQLEFSQQPIMKMLLSRKTNQYVSKKEIKIIYDYQLTKDYLDLNIRHFPPDSIINILTWNLNNGNLSNSVELINYLLEKNYKFNLDTISLCHLSLTFSMNFEMTSVLFSLNKELLNKRLLNRKFEKNLKISNFMLGILGVEYDIVQEDDQATLYINALRLVSTNITSFQIEGLQILYDYFIQLSENDKSDSRIIKLRSQKLLLQLINQNDQEISDTSDYKVLLNKIVEINNEYQQDDLFIYTYMISIAYLLSIQKESNSYIRDNLRSSRRDLEQHFEKFDFNSYGAFAKLLLVAVKNLEETSEEENLLRNAFPNLLKSYSIDELMRFLFVRYLIRSRVVIG